MPATTCIPAGCPQDPRRRDGGGRTAVFFRQPPELRIERGELVAADENPLEKAVIDGRPRLHRYPVEAAEIQDIPAAADGFRIVHIDVEPLVHHVRVHEGKLR